MSKSNVLRATLAVQLLFFVGWAAWLYAPQRNAPEVWLDTRPVDPRDYLSGHYVALSFRIARPDGISEQSIPPHTRVWVELVPSSATINLVDGRVVAPHVAGRFTQVEPPEGLWAQGIHEENFRGPIQYGIERFYVPETSELRNANGGEVIARVSVGRGGKLRVRELAKIRR